MQSPRTVVPSSFQHWDPLFKKTLSGTTLLYKTFCFTSPAIVFTLFTWSRDYLSEVFPEACVHQIKTILVALHFLDLPFKVHEGTFAYLGVNICVLLCFGFRWAQCISLVSYQLVSVCQCQPTVSELLR